jgi:hypothetical protein
VEVVPGRHFVAHAASDPAALVAGRPWVAASWLFLVEPLGPGRSRVVSRYRCATSGDRRTRLLFGPALLEPIGWAMDRKMLLGIRARAERSSSVSPPWSPAARARAGADAGDAGGREHAHEEHSAEDDPER